MIKVYPLKGLIAQHIFKDSKGQRQVLHPGETLADLGKTPQMFDGADPAVAAYLYPLYESKQIKIAAGDAGVMDAALAMAVDKGVEAAEEDHGKAIATLEEDHGKAIATLEEDHGKAIATLEEDHQTALATAADTAKTDQDTAVKTAVDAANEDSAKVLEDLGKEHAEAIDKINAAHAEALKAAKK